MEVFNSGVIDLKKYSWMGISIIVAGVLILLTFTVFHKPNRSPSIPSDPKPQDGTENLSTTDVVLSWGCSDPDGDPIEYDVYLGTDPTDIKIIAKKVNRNFIELSEKLEPGKTYYWYVVARDSKGAKSTGPVWQFSTRKPSHPPEIISHRPINGSANVQPDVVLKWEARDPDGDRIFYDVYFGPSPNPPLVLRNTSENSYSPGKLEYGKTYYWKVVARDPTGEKTSSPVWRFTTAEEIKPPPLPEPTNPPNGAKNVPLKVSLRWSFKNPQNMKFRYDLYFGVSGDMKLIAKNLDANHYELENLKPGTLYTWRVIVRDEKGVETKGEIWSFMTVANTPPSPPNSPIPANGEMDVSLNPTLSWDCSDPDGDALTYDLLFGTSESNLTIVSTALKDPKYNLKGLESGKTYFWQVIARDSKGATSTSDVWHFTTSVVSNKPPTPPIPISPVETENVSTSVTLSWKSSDADGDEIIYDLYFGTEPNPPLFRADLKSTSYQLKNLEYDTTYYWYVVAKDTKGATSKSKVWKFTTKVKSLPKPSVKTVIVAGGDEGVYTIDVSNPSSPSVIDVVNSNGIRRLSIGSSSLYNEVMKMIYAAAGEKGFKIFAFKNGNLKELTKLDTFRRNPVNVVDVKGKGKMAVLGLGIKGLGLVDATYPANPRWIGIIESIPGIVKSVFLDDSLVYVSCGRKGITVISISEPYAPRIVAQAAFQENVNDVFVSGKTMYVVDLGKGLSIYDITDVSSPMRLSSLNITGAERVYVKENHAFVIGENGLTIVDVSDERNPKILANVKFKGKVRGILVVPPYAYIASDEFAVVDVENPARPRKVGSLDFGSYATALTENNGKLIVADGAKGLKVFDLRDPANPEFVENISASEFVSDLLSKGDIVFTLDRIDGLIPVDMKNRSMIRDRKIPLPGFARRMVLYGNRLYIASELTNVLAIIDISNPKNPRRLEDLKLETTAYDIVKYHDKLITVGEKMIVIDGKTGKILKEIELENVAKSVIVVGDRMILGYGGLGISVYDISDPTSPKLIRNVYTVSADVLTAKGSIVVAGGRSGIAILDSQGDILSEIETPSPVLDVLLIGNYLYIADGENGLVVYDISDLKKPRLVKDFEWLNFYDAIKMPWEEKE